MDFRKLDFNALKRYTSPQAVKDFDAFLDAMPMNVGYNALIAAGLVWVMAGSAIMFTSMETEKVSKLHTDLMKVQALQPPVPVLKHIPVDKDQLKVLTDRISATFKGVSVTSNTPGSVSVSAQDTDYFPQFLAAISYLQRGGKNWKVRISTFCAGRDCQGNKLAAELKVEAVRLGEPEIKEDTGGEDEK